MISRKLHLERSRFDGYSLIELMVALTIGTIILAAVLSLFVVSKSSYNLQEDTTEIQENGRYAINTLAHDIRLSGYWGLAYHSDVVIDTTAKSQTYSGSVSSACSAADWVTSLQSIFGLNASTATANANTFTTCIPASEYKTGTDILVVRHASEQAAPVTTAGFENNIIYVQTALDKGRYFTGSPPAADSEYLVPLTNHEMNVH